MPEIDLEPEGYRRADTAHVSRRGLAKWLYFSRHPILAFIAYQKAYPDSFEEAEAFKERQSQAFLFGIGQFLIRRFMGH